MEVELTAERGELRTAARRFLESYLGTVPSGGPDPAWDPELWASALRLGWLSACSGADGGPVEAGVVAYEIGRAALPVPFLAAAGAVGALAASGAVADAEKHAAAIESDARVVALVADRVHAAPDGDGWRLSGGPLVVEWAAQADELVCIAELDAGRRLVVAVPAAGGGVRIEPADTLDHQPVGVLTLRRASVGPGGVVAAAVTDRAHELTLLLRAAEMVGGAQRVLELTCAHVNRRHQFGVPLSSFQAVQHLLADMATEVDGALLATWEGLTTVAAGRDARRSAAVAPYLAGRAYLRAVTDGAQLHGGIGVSQEYPLHRYFQRAQASRLRLGARHDQLERIAATLA
jgi:3-oxocholest-4-en-26-oyl-CoA dehydrogenase beta subunit